MDWFIIMTPGMARMVPSVDFRSILVLWPMDPGTNIVTFVSPMALFHFRCEI